MPRGGARPNSGPKPAARNQETAKIIQQAAEDGVLPLKVMLDNLRFYTKEADALLAQLLRDGAPPVGGDELNDNPHAGLIEMLKTVVGIRKLAGEEAARAAPYCHPRQGNAVEDAGGDVEVTLAERLAAYQRRDDIEQSAGKVIAADFGGK